MTIRIRELLKRLQGTQETPVQQTFDQLGVGCMVSGSVAFLIGLLVSNGLISGMGGFLLGIGFAINAMLPMVKI